MDAIEGLAPIGADYAHLPVAAAFTWRACADLIEPGEWYMVAFRSLRNEHADEARLTRYDDLAHAEAAASPGFVHYYRGPCSTDGSCLSFCLWAGRAEARAAAGKRDHAQAVTIVAEMYASYTLEFVRVTKAGHGQPLTFRPWDEPEVDRPLAA